MSLKCLSIICLASWLIKGQQSSNKTHYPDEGRKLTEYRSWQIEQTRHTRTHRHTQTRVSDTESQNIPLGLRLTWGAVKSWNHFYLVLFFLLFCFKQECKRFRAFSTRCLVQSGSHRDRKVGRLRSGADPALNLTAANSWALWPLLRVDSLILGVGTITVPTLGRDKCEEAWPRWYLAPRVLISRNSPSSTGIWPLSSAPLYSCAYYSFSLFYLYFSSTFWFPSPLSKAQNK